MFALILVFHVESACDIHHKKKNPNPLSCKKKKTIAPAPQVGFRQMDHTKKAGEKKKTRRSKKKAPTPAPLEAISQYNCLLSITAVITSI